ncbi:hypothetical protein PR048_032767 [Dryococelus australis]|uniref:Uncharacterized protein n=1 Tax=Dryococelus australis TaxID=614101 RepID=A0ABQ9G343_9NEOP|nr:hypothetical protein PR048_032767 [Dryococelus australis]
MGSGGAVARALTAHHGDPGLSVALDDELNRGGGRLQPELVHRDALEDLAARGWLTMATTCLRYRGASIASRDASARDSNPAGLSRYYNPFPLTQVTHASKITSLARNMAEHIAGRSALGD